MNMVAKTTNKVSMLAERYKLKPKSNPSAVATAKKSLQQLHHLKSLQLSSDSTSEEI